MPAKVDTKMGAALQLVRQQGSVRPRDLARRGIPPDYLDRLCRKGLAARVVRGVYVAPDIEVGEHHSLVEAGRRVPRGTICLRSALRFHGLTTQSPHEVWLALPPKAWSPRVHYPKLRMMRFSGPALIETVEAHRIEGVPVKVYGIAKTVADCFKFRNKIGLATALEALAMRAGQRSARFFPARDSSENRPSAGAMRAATDLQKEG